MVFVLAPQVASPTHLPQNDHSDRLQLLQIAIEGLADGLMIITTTGEVKEANLRARQICHHLQQSDHAQTAASFAPRTPSLRLPVSIWQNCQRLIAQNELRPGQNCVPEFELTLTNVVIRVRVRWVEVIGSGEPASEAEERYLLITLEERNRSTSDIRKYDLSEREMQVWRLRLQGYSYQDIAGKLYITINTVKKHMKNILAKQRLLEPDFGVSSCEELISA